MKFLALLGVLFRQLGLDRQPQATRAGRVTWELDLQIWDPNVPNHRQPPTTWRCTIAPSIGKPVSARGRDGAEALTEAMATLAQALTRRP